MTEVLPTNEARAKLNRIAAEFDHDGATAEPVLFGSHRRAQGVIVPWALWQRLGPAIENALDVEQAQERLASAGDERLTHEQLLAERARSLGAEDRWELVNELWESLESEDFPVAPEVQALLGERLDDVAANPVVGRTLPEIFTDWHAKRR